LIVDSIVAILIRQYKRANHIAAAMLTSNTITKATIILSSVRDWDEWIEVVKIEALCRDVWHLVNPDLPEESVSILTEPSPPAPTDINPRARYIKDLNPEEKEEYDNLYRIYNRQIKQYDRRVERLGSLRSFIQSTVARDHLCYMKNCDTTHQLLVKLQSRFRRSDIGRRDFLKAIEPLSPSFYSVRFHQQPKQNTKTCLCGRKHPFRDCWYLVKSKRPSNWTPNQRIEREINEKINRSAKLKDTIDRILQEQGKLSNEVSKGAQNKQKNDLITFTTAFYTNTSSADASELRDSVLLDSGATIHVCNDKRRFLNLRQDQTGGKVRARDTFIPIEGYGTITITVQSPTGPKAIQLLDTAFVPSFHTTVASLDRFMLKDVHWDTKKGTLTRDGKPYCKVERHHRQWVLEYNPLPKEYSIEASFSSSTAPRPIKSATADLWHQRLGHPGPESLEHLPETATGVKIIEAPITIECE